MAASISVLPVSDPDLPVLTDFLYHSKLSLTINRLLVRDWPNEEAQRKNCSNAIEGGARDPSRERLKAVDDATGEILGFIVLTRNKPQDAASEQSPDPEEKVAEPSVPEHMNPDVFWTVMQAVKELRDDINDADHYEITYIYVRPSSRKAGVGSRLLREGFNRAKDAGVPLVVSSEPVGHEFFRKRGLAEENHFDFDLSKWASPFSGFGTFRLARFTWAP